MIWHSGHVICLHGRISTDEVRWVLKANIWSYHIILNQSIGPSKTVLSDQQAVASPRFQANVFHTNCHQRWAMPEIESGTFRMQRLCSIAKLLSLFPYLNSRAQNTNWGCRAKTSAMVSHHTTQPNPPKALEKFCTFGPRPSASHKNEITASLDQVFQVQYPASYTGQSDSARKPYPKRHEDNNSPPNLSPAANVQRYTASVSGCSFLTTAHTTQHKTGSQQQFVFNHSRTATPEMNISRAEQW